MNKIDVHFHTTMSDGKYTNHQVIEEALNNGIDFAVATEHDAVNTDFVELAKENGINSLEGVEISSYDEKITRKSLHIMCYAEKFSGDILQVLEKTRKGKISKVKKQIDTLISNGFNIDYESFIVYYEKKGFDVLNLNSAHIAEYVFFDSKNIELIKELTLEDVPSGEFIRRCLKEDGDLRHIGWKNIDRYEPTVNEIGKIAKESGYFLSLAHPNFTFRDDIELFLFFIEEYKDLLNGIEINSLASKEWIDVILKTAKKYNLILTFGSDDHFIRDKNDDVHGKIGDINPHVSKGDLITNFRTFLLFLETTKKLNKLKQ